MYVQAESPWYPSQQAPKSSLMTSPSFSLRWLGIPWTTSLFKLIQLVPGKPYKFSNEQVHPLLSVYLLPSISNSLVVTPGIYVINQQPYQHVSFYLILLLFLQLTFYFSFDVSIIAHFWKDDKLELLLSISCKLFTLYKLIICKHIHFVCKKSVIVFYNNDRRIGELYEKESYYSFIICA